MTVNMIKSVTLEIIIWIKNLSLSVAIQHFVQEGRALAAPGYR